MNPAHAFLTARMLPNRSGSPTSQKTQRRHLRRTSSIDCTKSSKCVVGWRLCKRGVLMTLILPAQESTSFMRHAKRTKLKVEDIDYALRVRNIEVR